MCYVKWFVCAVTERYLCALIERNRGRIEM